MKYHSSSSLEYGIISSTSAEESISFSQSLNSPAVAWQRFVCLISVNEDMKDLKHNCQSD